jgi:hypothetical protein
MLPVDLASKRGKLDCELLLRQVASKGRFSLLLSMGWKNMMRVRVCSHLFMGKNVMPYNLRMLWYENSLVQQSLIRPFLSGKNDREIFRWGFRVVVLSLSVGAVWTWRFILQPKMADLYILHVCCIISQISAWALLLLTRFRDPGIVNPESQPIEAYDASLSEIGTCYVGACCIICMVLDMNNVWIQLVI